MIMNKSQEWINRADKHVMKTYGRYPIVAERGEGFFLFTDSTESFLILLFHWVSILILLIHMACRNMCVDLCCRK